MYRTTLLSLLSHCRRELDFVHKVAKLGFAASYLPPASNLETFVREVDCILFIVPKASLETRSPLRDLTLEDEMLELKRRKRRMEDDLGKLSAALVGIHIVNEELSKEIASLKEENGFSNND
jgi:hypothetical protein